MAREERNLTFKRGQNKLLTKCMYVHIFLSMLVRICVCVCVCVCMYVCLAKEIVLVIRCSNSAKSVGVENDVIT